jgi:hypothetical protein
MAQQTAVEWLVEELKSKGHALITSKGVFISVPDDLLLEAKAMEKEQRGYSKEDVLKAGEIGEINHHDYKHIVSLLDKAREINNK